jgi:hypothetical protein
MTLEELKAAWDEALAKANANPNDAGLKAAADAAEKAYNDAKAELEEEEKSQKGDKTQEVDESKWDERTKAYIQKLRNESATHRTKAKDLKSKLSQSEEQKRAILKAAGIELEDEKPEEVVKTLSAATQNLEFRNTVLELALEHGISAEQKDYFEFLITRECQKLAEDEELPEEKVMEIAKKAKGSARQGATTTVTGNDGKKGDPNPEPGATGEVSLADFCAMKMGDKIALYNKNPELYKRLATEARTKKKLI